MTTEELLAKVEYERQQAIIRWEIEQAKKNGIPLPLWFFNPLGL